MMKKQFMAVVIAVACVMGWYKISLRSIVEAGEGKAEEVKAEEKSPEQAAAETNKFLQEQVEQELAKPESERTGVKEQSEITITIEKARTNLTAAFSSGDQAAITRAQQEVATAVTEAPEQQLQAEQTRLQQELQKTAEQLGKGLEIAEGPGPEEAAPGEIVSPESQQWGDFLEIGAINSFGKALDAAISKAGSNEEKFNLVDSAYTKILSTFDYTKYALQQDALLQLSEVLVKALGAQTDEVLYRTRVINDRVAQIKELLENPNKYAYSVNQLDNSLQLSKKIPDDQRLSLMEDATVNVFSKDIIDIPRLEQLQEIAQNRPELVNRASDFIDFVGKTVDMFNKAEVIQEDKASLENLPQEVISQPKFIPQSEEVPQQGRGWDLSTLWEAAKTGAQYGYEQLSTLVASANEAILEHNAAISDQNTEFLQDVGKNMQQVGETLQAVPDYLNTTVEYMQMTEDSLEKNKAVKVYAEFQLSVIKLAVGPEVVEQAKSWLDVQWAQGKEFLQNPWVQTIATTIAPQVGKLAEVTGKIVEKISGAPEVSDIQEAREILKTQRFDVDFKQGSKALADKQAGQPSDPTIDTSLFTRFANKIKSVASRIVDTFKTKVLNRAEPTFTQAVDNFQLSRTALLSKLNLPESATAQEIGAALKSNPNIGKELGNLDSSLQQMLTGYTTILEGLNGIAGNFNTILDAYNGVKYELDESVATNVQALLRMRDEQLIRLELFDEGLAQIKKDMETLAQGDFAQPSDDINSSLSALSIKSRIELLKEYEVELQKIQVELDKRYAQLEEQKPEPPTGAGLFGDR